MGTNFHAMDRAVYAKSSYRQYKGISALRLSWSPYFKTAGMHRPFPHYTRRDSALFDRHVQAHVAYALYLSSTTDLFFICRLKVKLHVNILEYTHCESKYRVRMQTDETVTQCEDAGICFNTGYFTAFDISFYIKPIIRLMPLCHCISFHFFPHI